MKWPGVTSDNVRACAWGVSGDVTPADMRLTIDRIQAARRGQAYLIEGADVGIVHAPAHWEINKIKAEQARIELHSLGDALAATADPSTQVTRLRLGCSDTNTIGSQFF